MKKNGEAYESNIHVGISMGHNYRRRMGGKIESVEGIDVHVRLLGHHKTLVIPIEEEEEKAMAEELDIKSGVHGHHIELHIEGDGIASSILEFMVFFVFPIWTHLHAQCRNVICVCD